MSPVAFGVGLAMSVVASVGGFIVGWRGLHRSRLIEDVPTARVRSAHQGYVELRGRARLMDGPPIIAPLSMTPCCWYRFKVEEQERDRWDTVRSGRSDDLFLLEDGTGDCVVDPDGAEVTPAHKAVWFGSGMTAASPGVHAPTLRPQSRVEGVFHAGARVLSSTVAVGGGYRFTEEVILPGDTLYAVGQFRSIDDIDRLAHVDDIARSLLSEWKRNQQTLKARFDHDRNGVIDADEWQDARRAANALARDEVREQLEQSHVHLIARPDSRRPFLLSNLSQRALSRRYRRRGWGGLLAFLAGGVAATWLITYRWPSV